MMHMTAIPAITKPVRCYIDGRAVPNFRMGEGENEMKTKKPEPKGKDKSKKPGDKKY